MEVAELKAEKREQVGKESSKRLRVKGQVPAVLYSGGKATQITVDAREFSALTHSDAGTNLIVKIKIEGQKVNPIAIIKEIQRNPVKNEYFHVDFQEIEMNEKIATMVPVVPAGDAPGVKEGGVLERHTMEINLEGMPADMPDHIEVDVSGLGIGDNIHAKDLQLPKNTEMLTDPDELILAISGLRAAQVEAQAGVEGIAPESVAGGGEAAAATKAE